MSAVRTRYFIAEGPGADEIIAEWTAKRDAFLAQVDALVAKTGASDAVCSCGRLVCLAFPGIADRAGLRLKPEWNDANGAHFAYVPDKRTKAGKALAAEMEAVPRWDGSDLLTRRLSAWREVDAGPNPLGSGFIIKWSAATVIGSRIVVKVPETDEKPYTPSPLLREVKKSEFIAITEEQQEAA